MTWLKTVQRYARLRKRPVLKASYPRVGTSVIPLSPGDEQLFFTLLTHKFNSLTFEGEIKELHSLIHEMERKQGLTVHRMSFSEGNQNQVLHLHLGLPGFQEIRRVIRIQ
jgi:hypothetical protein